MIIPDDDLIGSIYNELRGKISCRPDILLHFEIRSPSGFLQRYKPGHPLHKKIIISFSLSISDSLDRSCPNGIFKASGKA